MKLTHLNKQGSIQMVDVGDKKTTKRYASAHGRILLSPETIIAINENKFSKGNVLAAAKIAGIMAAKNTSNLIPLCHPLPITYINIDLKIKENRILINAEIHTTAVTGVEMEALTAVSVAALTIYDMVKSVQKDAIIEQVFLTKKKGGKNGTYTYPNET